MVMQKFMNEEKKFQRAMEIVKDYNVPEKY